METPVKTSSTIIGKIWLNSDAEIVPASYELPQDMKFSANESYLIGKLSLRIDRNLMEPLNLEKGTKLFFFSNPSKREGKRDPDYSVSVRLPEAKAEAFIDHSKKAQAAWHASHPVNDIASK